MLVAFVFFSGFFHMTKDVSGELAIKKKQTCGFNAGVYLLYRELSYPTFGKGKSSSQSPWEGIRG